MEEKKNGEEGKERKIHMKMEKLLGDGGDGLKVITDLKKAGYLEMSDSLIFFTEQSQ